MRHARCCLLLLLLLAWCVGTDAAVPPSKLPPRVDLQKLPPGTIFIIGDDAKDALLQPGVVVLTPEKFKELLEQIDQLKKQTNPDKPETPSRCRLVGKVDGDLVHLQAQFDFETRKKKALVALGCQKAWPTGAVLDDGKLPLLPPPGDDGFVVQIEHPGTHRLTLDLDVPVITRGGKGADAKTADRAFEMGLPRAAITIVDSLDLPDIVKEVRFGTRPVAARDIHSRTNPRKTVALGPVDKLEVLWKGPAPIKPTDAILSVQGDINVRLDETHVNTDAKLKLFVDSGQVVQWQVQAPPPPTYELTVTGPGGDNRGITVTPPAPDAKNPLWTVKLAQPSSDTYQMQLQSRLPRPGKTVPIGPFAVPQALRQHGEITVSVPPDVRPRFRTRPEVSQREVPDDRRSATGLVAVFSYWNLPAPQGNQPVPPTVEMDMEGVKGAVETWISHQLRLTDEGWLVTSEIDVNPVRKPLETVEVELPAGYELRAGPPPAAEPDIEIKDAAKRIGIVKLTKKNHLPFKITLDGIVPVPQGKQALTVPLPRPVGTFDKGARVAVSVPEGQELLVARDSGSDIVTSGRRELSWRPERAPTRVELGWQAHRPELVAEGLADVTLTDRQVQVRQRLRFPLVPESIRELLLRAPDFPAGREPTVERGGLAPRSVGWVATLKDATVTLAYAVPLPEPDKTGRTRRVAVPLFWPEAATRCTMKVRVWSDGGFQAAPADGAAWEERPVEALAERETLPQLVLTSTGVRGAKGPEFPLTLQLTEPLGTPLAAGAVDRALIQAAVGDTGQQSYRARFLFHKVNGKTLDVELPAAPATLGLEVWLDGKRLPSWQTVDDDGRESETGRIARLRVEPELYRRPVVLELRYHMAKREGSSRFQTTLSPPVLRGNVLPGRTRWQVALPSDLVVVHAGAATPEQRWGLRGGLPALRPAATAADLERWFHGGVDAATVGPEADPDVSLRPPELVAGQANLGALPVTHVAQQTWLLFCSLLLVAVGLTLYFVPLPRLVFWPVLAALGLAFVVSGLVWPRVLATILYGALPGVVVLVLVIGVQWLLQRRQRQQVVFMPAFSRLGPGSSIIRGSSSGPRRHEPSTVDAPPGVLASDVMSGSKRLSDSKSGEPRLQ